jgi:thymidine kinase
MLIKNSYLKIIIGPMFSSKSTFLLKELNRYSNITKNIICINHSFDKIRNNTDTIKTHNNESCKSFMLDKLNELKEINEYQFADVVLIDEGQFFEDLYIFIENELRNGSSKIFIVAGLSGDIFMKPIGNILSLIPLADEIEKLSALCIGCSDGTLAHFTKRKNTDNKEVILISAEENYIPVCRKCYYM